MKTAHGNTSRTGMGTGASSDGETGAEKTGALEAFMVVLQGKARPD
jgi:hypothetical protein